MKQLTTIHFKTIDGRAYCDMMDIFRMIRSEQENCPDNPDCIAGQILRNMQAALLVSLSRETEVGRC